MNALENTPFEAHFLEGTSGRLFGLYFPAMGKPRGQLLCISPFAEESNRSRVMLGMGARALAHQGYGTLILDVLGTGNSNGDFEQANWSIWVADIRTGIAWLRSQPGDITLWGTRLGALLAVDAAQADPEAVKRLLLWQPVISGKQMFTQYLRLRVANSLELDDQQVTTKSLRALLAQGQTLEVGGYYISPQMAADLDARIMPDAADLPDMPIVWLELVDQGKSELSLASQRVVKAWQAQQKAITAVPFHGPAFWQLHERFLAPDLVNKTVQVLNDG